MKTVDSVILNRLNNKYLEDKQCTFIMYYDNLIKIGLEHGDGYLLVCFFFSTDITKHRAPLKMQMSDQVHNP